MVAPLNHASPATVAGAVYQAERRRVLAILSPLEIRILAAHLYDQASFDEIADTERLDARDVAAITYSAVVQLHKHGYTVRLPASTRRPHHVAPQLTSSEASSIGN
jgi:hypothetical protein